jgi:DeoR family transcriptional regulator, fructose operon transcriptional repressor
MFAQERHNAIVRLVRERRRLTFAELQEQIQVSAATLRRDLTELESAGAILRVHGGVLDPGYVRADVSFEERLLRNSQAKKSIARQAAALVPTGSIVIIDAGSTCLETAKALLGRSDVRILTHSVAVLSAAMHAEASVVSLGGELRKVSGALVGGTSLGSLEVLHADIAFLSASGLLAEEGCFTTELSEAEIKRAILKRASRKILLADVTKWQNPSTVRFAAWEDFNDWVTDAAPSTAEIKKLKGRGIAIHAS